MEKSKVYFTSFKTSFTENLMQKLARLVKTAGIETIDFQDHYAAIKIHFGEYWRFSARIMQKSLQIS